LLQVTNATAAVGSVVLSSAEESIAIFIFTRDIATKSETLVLM
jgi:hypothetical protein